jgi:hypothetical protein
MFALCSILGLFISSSYLEVWANKLLSQFDCFGVALNLKDEEQCAAGQSAVLSARSSLTDIESRVLEEDIKSVKGWCLKINSVAEILKA